MPKVLHRFNAFTGILEQMPVYGDQFKEAVDPTVSITTSETFRDKLLLDVGILKPSAVYHLDVSYKWNHNATNSDFEARVLDVNNNALAHLDGWHKQEPQDSGGNWEGTGSDQRYLATEKYRIIGAGVLNTFLLQWRTDDANDESSIWDVLMSFKRVS